jgi:Protein of unknown function (DUF3313)
MKTRFSAIVLTLALAAGSILATADDTANNHSGFLSDYSQLQPASGREGVMRYINKSLDLRPYTKVTFDPVHVFLTANPDYKGIQPDALKSMTDQFLASFKRALQPEYEIVDAPGPDVLRVRLAITGIQPARPQLRPRDLIPVKALIHIARAAAGRAPEVAEMTAEMEVLNPSGNRVVAGVMNRKGNKQLNQSEDITWDDLAPIADYWAKISREWLDEARAATQ